MEDINVILGIEKVRVGTGSSLGIVTDWVELENIAPDSVTHTKNNGTVSGVIPEDKDTTLYNVYAAAEPGTLTIGLLEQRPSVMQRFFNVLYDIATSKITVLAKEKIASVAIEITSRPVGGKKCIMTWYNTDAQTGFSNNIAKTVSENLAIVASIKSYKFMGEDASYSKQWVLENGTPIDATEPTVSAGANSTASTNPKVVTATATGAGSKTIVSKYWEQVSGPSTLVMATPNELSNSLSNLVTGVYVLKFTAMDNMGIAKSSTVQVTATIA